MSWIAHRSNKWRIQFGVLDPWFASRKWWRAGILGVNVGELGRQTIASNETTGIKLGYLGVNSLSDIGVD